MLKLGTPTGDVTIDAHPFNKLGAGIAVEGILEGFGRARLVAHLTPVQAERAAAELRLVVPTAARAVPLPIVPDPWVHRSERMRCATCMWYVAKEGNRTDGAVELGRCRRHAPVMAGYPVVFPHDWCGDHKLNEAAAPTAEF